MPRVFPLLVVVAVCAGPAAASPQIADPNPGAQQAEVSAPAHVSAVEGQAILHREGRGETLTVNMPLLEGDSLRTSDGRVEVVLPDGSVLALDRASTIDLLANGLVRLTAGRLVFVVARGAAEARDYAIDAPGGSVRLGAAGEYRVAVEGAPETPQVSLEVVRGRATLEGDLGSVLVVAGQRSVTVAGSAPEVPAGFNSAAPDAFHAWSDERRAERVGTVSNSYLPEELRVYGGTFDRYGTWREAPEAGVGYVWYPRVAVDWRPYNYGAWWSYPAWGWTWIGYDPWAWPTHHYGRWGFGVGGWYWIPSSYWGPAWVAWGGAPGYAAWCPLGYWGGPVFSFGVSLSFGGHHYSHWHGWSVVPYHAFSKPYYHVGAYAVHGGRLPPGTRNAFAVQHGGPHGPAGAGRAVARSWASGTAVPRGGAGGSLGAARPGGGGAGGGVPGGSSAFAGTSRAFASATPGGARPSPPGAGALAPGSPGAATRGVPSAGSRPSVGAPPAGTARLRESTSAPSATSSAPFAGSRPSSAAPSTGTARSSAAPFAGSARSLDSTRPPSATSPAPFAGSRPSYRAPSGGASRPLPGASRPSYSAPSGGASRAFPGASRPSYAAPGSVRPSYPGARPSRGAPSAGMARPFSGASRPSYAGPPAARPFSGASRPSFGPPSGGGARPSFGAGSRPSFGAPSIGAGRPAPGGGRPSYGSAAPRGGFSGGGPRASGGGARPSGGGARPSGGARRR